MKKTDVIKFRCTPQAKAQLVREAAYRQITLTQLIEERVFPLVIVEAPEIVAPFAEAGLLGSGLFAKAIADAEAPQRVTLSSACPHGRPAAMCWECR